MPGSSLRLAAQGDTAVDLHHTVEDTGLVLGEALASALGERRGVVRFAHAYAPLDEALARAVIDLSGRGFFVWTVPPELEQTWVTREFPLTLVADFFQAFADRGRLTLHLTVVAGRNPAPCRRGLLQSGGDGAPAGSGAARRRHRRERGAEHQRNAGRMSVATTVVDLGVGNLGNVIRALAAAGGQATVTADPSAVRAARRIVLPGVGAFRPPRERLRGELESALRGALADGARLLGICVGYQLLFEGSDEFGATAGLGLLRGRVTELPREVARPHIGWNRLESPHAARAARRHRPRRLRLLRAQFRAGRCGGTGDCGDGAPWTPFRRSLSQRTGRAAPSSTPRRVAKRGCACCGIS